MDKYILIGKITTVHGIKGAVKIVSYAEKPEEIFNYKIYDKNGQIINIKKIGILNNGLFISQINNINDRNEAEKLKNLELYIDKNDLKSLDDNEFYVNELIGMNVDSNEGTGKVANLYNYGAGNIMEIKLTNGKNIDIPFSDLYVKEIDKKNNLIFLDIPKFI